VNPEILRNKAQAGYGLGVERFEAAFALKGIWSFASNIEKSMSMLFPFGEV